jgi:hypothetical protein
MNERKFISLKKPDNLLKNKNPLPPFNPDNYENPYRENKTEFIQNEIEYKIIDGEIYPILKQDNNIYQKILKEASKWSRSDMAYETAVNLDDDMKNYQGCLNIFKAKVIQERIDYSDLRNWEVWAVKDIKADKIIIPYVNMNISDDDIQNYDTTEHSKYYSKKVNVLGKDYLIISSNRYAINDIEKIFMSSEEIDINYKSDKGKFGKILLTIFLISFILRMYLILLNY